MEVSLPVPEISYLPSAPVPSLNEMQAALAGTVEEWVEEALGQPTILTGSLLVLLSEAINKDIRSMKESLEWTFAPAEPEAQIASLSGFIRMVGAQQPKYVEDGASQACGGELNSDHKVLCWLWLCTEVVTKGEFLFCIRVFFNLWHPYVQPLVVGHACLTWSAQKIDGFARDAHLIKLQEENSQGLQ